MNIKYGLYLTGVRSFAINYDDPQQDFAFNPFSQSGMWVIPIIRGYPNVFLNIKK